MRIIATRNRIDVIWLAAGAALLAWWFVCLLRGETYIPSKRGPGHLYQLAVSPREYWSAMKFQAVFTAITLLGSILHFPAFEAWNARTRRKMESERRNPVKRSFLWMAAAYVILPLALVIGFLALLVHLGVR